MRPVSDNPTCIVPRIVVEQSYSWRFRPKGPEPADSPLSLRD
jgi:hypothetical protein